MANLLVTTLHPLHVPSPSEIELCTPFKSWTNSLSFLLLACVFLADTFICNLSLHFKMFWLGSNKEVL